MGPATLVTNQIEEGQQLLDQLGEKEFAVRNACWVKLAEQDRWALYVVSPVVDEKGGLKEAYLRLLKVLATLGPISITSSDITLVGEKHPVANFLRHRPVGQVGVLLPGQSVGGVSADEVYIYPVTGKPSRVPIYGLSFRGEPGGTVIWGFVPPDPHTTLTIEGVNGIRTYPAQTGLDWEVAVPAGSKLVHDDTGRTVLEWELFGQRRQSTAGEVLSLAKLGLRGFRVLPAPP